jgi:hypothetical protein
VLPFAAALQASPEMEKKVESVQETEKLHV